MRYAFVEKCTTKVVVLRKAELAVNLVLYGSGSCKVSFAIQVVFYMFAISLYLDITAWH